MAYITHLRTAVPRHPLDQHVAASAVAHSLGLGSSSASAVQDLFQRAAVDQRYSVLEPSVLEQPRSLTQTMELYRTHAAELATEAARACLAEAELDPQEIDMVVTCSCTGVLLPSLSVLMAQELGLRSDVRRMPMTEAGCSGGACALARADDYARAFDDAHVLVVAVELPSLTLQRDDRSRANLIASALFGDGAAAALVQGRAAPQRAQPHSNGDPRTSGLAGVEIVATHTEVLPESVGDLGFDLRDGGLHIVLSKQVPHIISRHLPRVLDEFLAKSGLTRDDLSFFVLHPGGRKVLDALESSLGLGSDRTRISRDVLRQYGNQSSASVLFVLEQTLAHEAPQGYGILAAFGPGITAELSLLRGDSASSRAVDTFRSRHARSLAVEGAPC